VFPKAARLLVANGHGAGHAASADRYWLLSLYSPAEGDGVDWKSGNYALETRGGRIEHSPTAEKKRVRMIAEGSVLAAGQEPTGTAVDVAPEGFAHPVYRSGFAVAVKLPVIPEVVLEEEKSELAEILESISAPEPVIVRVPEEAPQAEAPEAVEVLETSHAPTPVEAEEPAAVAEPAVIPEAESPEAVEISEPEEPAVPKETEEGDDAI
jgi:hypothetical protein